MCALGGGGICICISSGQTLTALPASTLQPLKSRLFIEIENEAKCGREAEKERAQRQREAERERKREMMLKPFHHFKSINFCAAFFFLKKLLPPLFLHPFLACVTAGTIVACTPQNNGKCQEG